MMKKIIYALIVSSICVGVLAASPASHPTPAGMQRLILIFGSGKGPAPNVAALGGKVEFSSPTGMVVTVPDAAVDALRHHPRIHMVQRSVLGSEIEAILPHDEIAPGAPAAMPTPAPAVDPIRRFSAVSNSASSWTTGAYVYDGAGNISSIGTAGEPNSDGWTNAFTYDKVGRLTSGSANYQTINSQSYVYDEFGNIKSITTTRSGTTVTVGIGIDAPTNHVSTSDYENGNETVDHTDNAHRRYDALNMLTSKSPAPGIQAFYVYGPNDERIGSLNGTDWTWTIRDEGGKVLREYKSDENYPTWDWLWLEDYVYRDSALLAADRPQEEGGRRYFHLDHLGTPRLITGAGGGLIARHDYLPFGLEITPNVTELAQGYDRVDPMHFTGHERDLVDEDPTSTNYLDYMHARYYVTRNGRFLSVDPVSGNPSNPQSWNRYAYVANNPVGRTDPNGKCFGPFAGAMPLCQQLADEAEPYIAEAYVFAVESPAVVVNAIGGAITTLAEMEENAVSSVTDHKADETPTEGVYEFPDKKAPGKVYVGQSGNVPKRLKQHEDSGKKDPADPAKVKKVEGGKTVREAAEQKRINDLGGTKNNPGSKTSNVRNPMGPKRESLFQSLLDLLK